MKIPQTQWQLPEPIIVSEELYQSTENLSFLAELLARRGITQPEDARSFLDPEYYKPTPPQEIPDLEKAAGLITQAIRSKTMIGIWGDFDVDGQTATTILVSTLRNLGALVDYHIPVRAKESHGISIPYLKDFLSQGVKLLITCDTGISAIEAADFTRNAKVPMIITDHHLLPATLPLANAILNPKQLAEDHPLSSLSGVGVAFELALALYSENSLTDKASDLYDLVALGLIADQAKLQGDTRFLTQKGISKLQKTDRLAIREILSQLDINQANISEEHISYYLAPRLNALGRLADANPVVEFLLSTDTEFTREFALHLEKLNEKRKILSDQVFQAANAQVCSSREILDAPLIILSHPAWPDGVIGIVASQLVEIYNRPVILLSTHDSGIAHGSARSIEGIDITQAIASQKEFLVTFGGHSMAAGLSLKMHDLPSFHKGIARYIHEKYVGKTLEKTISIDSFLKLSEINTELVNLIEKLAPFGPGNPNPVLAARSLTIKSNQSIGKAKEHRTITVEDQAGQVQKVLWWKGARSPLPEGLFDLVFTVRSSNYQGQISPQVEWIDTRPSENSSIDISSKRKYRLVDYRNNPNPKIIINELLSEENSEVYWEGYKDPTIHLPKSEYANVKKKLIIATIPPNRYKLLKLLESKTPEEVFLFGINPNPPDQIQPFLEYLAGLVKFTIHEKKGELTMPQLEHLTGHSEMTNLSGLNWLSAHGDIQFRFLTSGSISLKAKGIVDSAKLEIVEKELAQHINEARAFRSYYMRTEIANLL